jgi:hypothetical protein
MLLERPCALCAVVFEPEEQSHIVSAFVYRWLKESSATGFMRFLPKINQRTQDGIKDYFLCPACEDRLSGYEDMFSKKIFYPYVRDDSVSVDYGEYLLKFAVGASWRLLAYGIEKRGLAHFRGRHSRAVDDTLKTWQDYLLDRADDVGLHEIHLLPLSGIVDHNADHVPAGINRYLRRCVEINVGVSDAEAFTYCKLGPMILIGLIEYPDLDHWQNTKIAKKGRFGPGDFVAPGQYKNFIFERCQRMFELQRNISGRQRAAIEESYGKDIDRWKDSDTYDATLLDMQLQIRSSTK